MNYLLNIFIILSLFTSSLLSFPWKCFLLTLCVFICFLPPTSMNCTLIQAAGSNSYYL